MKWQILLAVAIFALIFQGGAGAAIDRDVEPGGVGAGCGLPPAEHPEMTQVVSAAAPPAATPLPTNEKSVAASKTDPAVPQVELYVTSWCPYCKKAKEFFRSQGIPFIAYDIEKDSAAARRREQLDSSSGVPLAIINGQKIHGFSEALYREALKKRP